AGQIGGSSYDTVLTMLNFGPTPATMTITLHQNSGALLTARQTMTAYGFLRTSVTSMFSVSSIDGWIQIDGGGGFVTGFLVYTDRGTLGTTAVELQPTSAADSALIFGHLADVSPWWTGIALA